MSFAFNFMSLVMQSYAIFMSLVCHSYAICMYTYVIHIPFICTCMSLLCHLYITHLYLYVTRMTPVCTRFVIRMPLLCTHMSFVYHSYVLVCHSYVLYVIRAIFTKNFFKAVVTMHIQRSRRKYLIKSKSYRLSNNNYFCKPIINVLKRHWLTLSLTLHDYQFSQSLSCCHPKTAFIFYAKIMDVCGRNHLYEYIMKGNISITKLH